MLEKNDMKLIYFAYGNVSVFDSQVVSLLNYYVENNMITEITLVIGIRSNVDIDKNIKAKINKKISIRYYKYYPQYPFIEGLS